MQNSNPLSPLDAVAEHGSLVFDPDIREMLEQKHYNADYIEQNPDTHIDLKNDSLDRPHQITSTNLVTNPLWIDSARTLYGLFATQDDPPAQNEKALGHMGQSNAWRLNKPGEEISDEDIGEWGLELMGQFNWNLVDMAQMAYQIQSAPVEQRVALYSMLNLYDELPNFTWDGSSRMLRGLATDVSSWLGLTTLGAGFLARQAAKHAGKTGIMAALRATLPAGILTGIEGGVYASVDDASRQHVAIAAMRDSEQRDVESEIDAFSKELKYDWGRTGLSAGIGGTAGLILGTAAPHAIPALVRGTYKGFNAAWSELKETARAAQQGTVFSGVPTKPASAIRATGVPLGDYNKKLNRVTSGSFANRKFEIIDESTGREVGAVYLKENLSEVADIKIADQHRGKGLANAVYDEVEKVTGVKIKPSDNLSESGYRLWQRRDPSQVADSLYQFKDDLIGKTASDGRISGTITSVHNGWVSIKKGGVSSPVSRDQLRDQGLIPPKPASATRATGAKRGVRKTEEYQITPDEKADLATFATKANVKSTDVEAEYIRIKTEFPESDGWSPLEVTEVKVNKKGKIELKFKEQPYGFHNVSSVDDVADSMTAEVLALKKRVDNGDPVAIEIWEHRKWYSEMRQRLRKEFGSFGDVVADVLGTTSAQTNVQQNWKNMIEVMHRFTRGEYDDALTKLDMWLKDGGTIGSGKPANNGYVDNHYRIKEEAKAAALKQGMTDADADEAAMAAAQAEFPLITKKEGALFNTNSPATMLALLDLFREITPGTSPKTPNFAFNLIGLSDRATIDLWAARNLRRLVGLPRIPVPAEGAVGGEILARKHWVDGEPRSGGEFGFGQDVYRATNDRLRQKGIDLNDDDLQAIVWFLEKEVWTENNWTTRAGEGGSLETEIDFAGHWNPEGIEKARSTLSSDSGASVRREIEEALADPARKKVYDDAVAAIADLSGFIEARTAAKQRDFVMQNEGIEDKNVAVERAKEIRAQLAKHNRVVKVHENLLPRLEERIAKREGEVAQAEKELERKVPARRFLGGISLQGQLPSEADVKLLNDNGIEVEPVKHLTDEGVLSMFDEDARLEFEFGVDRSLRGGDPNKPYQVPSEQMGKAEINKLKRRLGGKSTPAMEAKRAQELKAQYQEGVFTDDPDVLTYAELAERYPEKTEMLQAAKRVDDQMRVAIQRVNEGADTARLVNVPTDVEMSEAQGRLISTADPDPTVLMVKATSSTGRYIDPKGKKWDERTIDFEYVAREDHDPADITRQLVQEAKDANQEAAFFSEVVDPGTVENANPGLELYFNRDLTKREVLNLTKIINNLKLNIGFTFATDIRFAERQAAGAELGDIGSQRWGKKHNNYVGLRMQYIPEFGDAPVKNISKRINEIEKVLLEKLDYINSSQYTEYDTRVFFRDSGDYDAYLAGNVQTSR